MGVTSDAFASAPQAASQASPQDAAPQIWSPNSSVHQNWDAPDSPNGNLDGMAITSPQEVQALQTMPGLISQPTIGLGAIPQYSFPQGAKAGDMSLPPGAVSSEHSITHEDENKGLAVIIPTIYEGKLHSNSDAIKRYQNTGLHLGGFNLAAERATNFKQSDAYSEAVGDRHIFINGKKAYDDLPETQRINWKNWSR